MEDELTEVLEPDYYPLFRCKCGRCRVSCCGGWGISISMEEYFRLFGMDCTPALRDKMDRALHVLPDASPERYAQLTCNWLGRCPIQREDGYCALQWECGEQALPQVCRQYPRGLRNAFEAERACSNSCEATLELLFSREQPITLRRVLAKAPPREGSLTPAQIEQQRNIRDGCLSELQDRTLPLPVRLMRLGFALRAADAEEPNGTQAQMEAGRRASAAFSPEQAPPPDTPRAFAIQQKLVRTLALGHPGVQAEASAAWELFGDGPDAADIYARTARTFAEHYPKWELWFEQMLVNHVLFEAFPYSDRRQDAHAAYAALCATYGMVRFLAIGCTTQRHDTAQLVDVCAAAFRLIAHTAFSWNAPIVLGPDADMDALWVLVQN